jgi:hypothetical protein
MPQSNIVIFNFHLYIYEYVRLYLVFNLTSQAHRALHRTDTHGYSRILLIYLSPVSIYGAI